MVRHCTEPVCSKLLVEPDSGLVLGHDVEGDGSPYLICVGESGGHEEAACSGGAVIGINEQADNDREIGDGTAGLVGPGLGGVVSGFGGNEGDLSDWHVRHDGGPALQGVRVREPADRIGDSLDRIAVLFVDADQRSGERGEIGLAAFANAALFGSHQSFTGMS